MKKKNSDSLSDTEGQGNRLQLSIRKNLPIVVSGNDMRARLSSEKAIKGGNQETLERCWTTLLLMLLKTPIPSTLTLSFFPPINTEESEKTNSENPTEVGHKSKMA